MSNTYQLIVIGAGPAGTYGAIRASQLGMRVVLVEKAQVGGVCLNQGCIPSKALLKSARLFEIFNEAKSFGIRCEKISHDYSLMWERSRKVVERLSKGMEFLLKKHKIDFIKGPARLTGPHQVSVEPSISFKADRILIATGTAVKEIPGFKIDGRKIISSDHALAQTVLPKSIFILGGGAVGAEFAYFYRALGVDVTILEAQGRLLPGLEVELGQELERSFRKKGMRVLCGSRASRAQVEGDVVKVSYEDKDRVEKELYAAQVLVAVGRQPFIEGLGLEALGVHFENGYIKVAENFQTSVPSLFAVGDIIGPPLLAHAASEEAKVAVEMMAGKRSEGLDRTSIPSCVYTHPEVASVGLSEEDAKGQNFSFKIGKFPFRALGRALAEGSDEGFVKTVVDENGRLLGAHVIGENATEVIAELTLIRTLGLTVEQISKVVHAHPTFSEGVLEGLLAAEGRALNA